MITSLPYPLFFFAAVTYLSLIITHSAAIPFIIEENHPVKADLDTFFGAYRWTENLKTLEKGGFKKASPQPTSKVVVTSHPLFPGYIFKIYLDEQPYHKERFASYYWIKRIEGAEKIREQISFRGLENVFKVPKKWIYKLPKNPKPVYPKWIKEYILVAEDMEVLSSEENLAIWRSDRITYQLLDDLYQIVSSVQLYDGCIPENIPFTRDGRIAFVDTQAWGNTVLYSALNPYLSEKNLRYWKRITGQSL